MYVWNSFHDKVISLYNFSVFITEAFFSQTKVIIIINPVNDTDTSCAFNHGGGGHALLYYSANGFINSAQDMTQGKTSVSMRCMGMMLLYPLFVTRKCPMVSFLVMVFISTGGVWLMLYAESSTT